MSKGTRELLKEIYSERFGDLELGTSESWVNLAELAEELSDRFGDSDKPWGKRYLYSILKYDNYKTSKKLTAALRAFAAICFDDASPMIARRNKKVIYSKNGNIKAGSIVMGASVQCICGAWIVPRSWNGKYCSDDCRKKARWLRRRKR